MTKYPRISIITPSYNQAEFLERTIQSVLDQEYPDLEYIIIDGGSTDGSVDIIKKYASHLAYWVSEPDNGQTEAINKGLRRATGEWITWQNSDDFFYPGAFEILAREATQNPNAGLIIGNVMLIDENDNELRDVKYVKPSYRALLAEGMVLTNQAAFWRRDLQDKVGVLNEDLDYSFDYEWFLRVSQCTEGVHVNQVLGAYRLHPETKTSLHATKFIEERESIMKGRQPGKWEIRFYRFRRIALILLQGNFSYILRGLRRHLQGKGKELY